MGGARTTSKGPVWGFSQRLLWQGSSISLLPVKCGGTGPSAPSQGPAITAAICIMLTRWSHCPAALPPQVFAKILLLLLDKEPSLHWSLCITLTSQLSIWPSYRQCALAAGSLWLIFTSTAESFIIFQRRPSCGLWWPPPPALLVPAPCSTCRAQVYFYTLQKPWNSIFQHHLV